MKYYSEILDQKFDTEKELLRAEREHEKAQSEKKEELAGAKAETAVSKEKKILSDAVTKAEEELSVAYDELDVANQKVKTLSKEYLKQVDSILEPAKKKVKDAQQKKYEAIKAFNEKFGPFRTIYTGQKAIDEFSRINKLADDFWNRFWF